MERVALIDFPKAVFFDWDGTLVNSLAFLTKAHNYAKTQMGLPLFAGDHEFQPYLGMPRDALYADIYGARGEEAKVHFETYVHQYHTEGVKPLKGAAELLELLYDIGIPCGVVSNKRSVFLREEIKTFGWERYFKAVVGAGDAPEDKPSAAPLLFALEKSGLGVDISDVWYIGDTEFDVACAKRAGARAIVVRPPYEQDKDFNVLPHKPDLIKNSSYDFIAFLQEMDAFPKSRLIAQQ